MPCWNCSWEPGRYRRVFQMTPHFYEYAAEPSHLSRITLWSPLNLLSRSPLVMTGKRISGPQADNTTQTHKNVSKSFELNVALERVTYWYDFFARALIRLQRGCLQTFQWKPVLISSLLLWETLSESVRALLYVLPQKRIEFLYKF